MFGLTITQMILIVGIGGLWWVGGIIHDAIISIKTAIDRLEDTIRLKDSIRLVKY